MESHHLVLWHSRQFVPRVAHRGEGGTALGVVGYPVGGRAGQDQVGTRHDEVAGRRAPPVGSVVSECATAS